MAPLVSFRNQSGGDRGGWQAATDWGTGAEEVTMGVVRLGVVSGRADPPRNGEGDHAKHGGGAQPVSLADEIVRHGTVARRSVVEGQTGSARVELGGRRIMRNKQINYYMNRNN